MTMQINSERDAFLNRVYMKSNSKNSLLHATKALKKFDEYLAQSNQTESSFIDEFTNKPITDIGIYNACNDIIASMSSLDPASQQTYFSVMRNYLITKGIITMDAFMKSYVSFPKKVKERRHALDLAQLQAIIKNSNMKYRALYSLLAVSGMRITEALSLGMNDVDWDSYPVKIRIRAETTKTVEERESYMTGEVFTKFVKPLIVNKKENELIFWSDYPVLEIHPAQAVSYFHRLRAKLGFNEKYKTGFYHVNQHSMRAWFFTKAAMKHKSDYAHAMLGHHEYLATYFRLPDEERKQLYLDLEPELALYSSSANE